MGTVSDVLRIARAEIGTKTGKKYWDFYFKNSIAYINGSKTPYCACWTSWVYAQAGVTAAGIPNSYCPYICNAGNKAGKLVNKYSSQPGDIVLFDWNKDGVSDHVGIVESNQGNYLQTIEGNTNGGVVARRTRSFNDICHIVRPNYSSASTSKSEVKRLDVDGWAGPATITRLQQALKVPETYVDGVLSGQDLTNKEFLGNVWSCEWNGLGSLTVEYLQQKIGADEDGLWGYQTSQLFQKYLIRHGYSVGPEGADGYFGLNSCKALQRALNEGLIFK